MRQRPSTRSTSSTASAPTALRWWLARDVGAVADTDFTERAARRAAPTTTSPTGVGNVVNRVATLVRRARAGGIDVATCAKSARDAEIETIVAARLQEFDLRGATAALLDAIAVLNRDLESTAPWRLSPDRDSAELSEILGRQLATARAIAAAATPIVPALATRLAEHFESEVPDGSPFARRTAP